LRKGIFSFPPQAICLYSVPDPIGVSNNNFPDYSAYIDHFPYPHLSIKSYYSQMKKRCTKFLPKQMTLYHLDEQCWLATLVLLK
jgi:hypothetical protein